ncbi:MAG: hypothetical protein QY307_03650 [Acidimicrobiia bacterium]|nr:MAG: hypothetical protein QY307_03650 [Acidimicrobiia bacterium]
MTSSRLPVLLLATLMVVSACGDDDASSSTTAGAVVFGEGEVPATFPDDFPIPGNSVIGLTLIDPPNHKSEMNLSTGSDFVTTVQFFTLSLVSAGYVLESSYGDELRWEIGFRRGEVVGTVVVSPQGTASQVAVTINTA